jgi:UDP-N-acetylglucosamine:LPS N-acetylglucosamine transferase
MKQRRAKRRLKICLVCSVGGHFKQLLKLTEAWENCKYFYVLFYKPVIDSFLKKEKVYLVTSPERNPILFILNIIQSLFVFLKTWPDVVISTGAGVAIAICYIAKLFQKKVIYIEDWCIVEQPSVTGRVVYPIADLFIIQREHLKKFYPKATFGGELF